MSIDVSLGRVAYFLTWAVRSAVSASVIEIRTWPSDQGIARKLIKCLRTVFPLVQPGPGIDAHIVAANLYCLQGLGVFPFPGIIKGNFAAPASIVGITVNPFFAPLSTFSLRFSHCLLLQVM
jgi:hypothetical protein